MFDYLVDHALKHVWCNPAQDRQHIFAPYRITPSTGSFNTVKVMMSTISLPTSAERYHVFQVGDIPPSMLDIYSGTMDGYVETWRSIAESMNTERMVIDVYTDSGVHYPSSHVYYMFTKKKNLIIAIKESSKISIDYRTEQPYFRVYSNAYFETASGNDGDDLIFNRCVTITATSEILTLQNLYNSYTEKQGNILVYKNGILTNGISLLNIGLGDIVDMRYDSTIFRVVDLTVGDLHTFTSTLDNVRKYLLHYPDTDDEDRIFYHDDMDIYVLNYTSETMYSGLFYHKNMEEACRMVTHRDYSIMVDPIVRYSEKLASILSSTIDPLQLKVRLYLRNSGYNRPLVFENQRFFELYKLADSDVYSSLIGTTATVECWSAPVAEASMYTAIMRMNGGVITRDIVQTAYGYNAISKLLGDTPSLTRYESSRQIVDVPYGLQNYSTAYEYDKDGLLLGKHTHTAGDTYASSDSNCKLVEIISGIGDQYPDIRFGTTTVTLPTYANYRVYICHATSSGYDEVWSDITDSGKYTVADNVLTWVADEEGQFIMVRTDVKFIDYSMGIKPEDGIVKFSLSEYQNRGSGYVHRLMSVPAGELDIFMNGRSLIHKLDYFIDFPEVVVINKEYLTDDPNNTDQDIRIRFTGFCNEDLTIRDDIDCGFIEHGFLSNNNKFDIRDDKVLRIVIDGAVYDRSELEFSELTSGISVTDSNNGKPYSIRDIVVPLKDLTNESTYSLRKKSQAIDETISSYLTEKLPQPTRSAPSAITSRYSVYSPFVSKLIGDVKSGYIDSDLYTKVLTSQDVYAICKGYESWLKYDPSQPDTAVDADYVIIHPYNVNTVTTLNLYQYRFISKAVELYCNGLVNLSGFIALEKF